MPPNNTTCITPRLAEKVQDDVARDAVEGMKDKKYPKQRIIWLNVFNIGIVHLLAVWGIYRSMTSSMASTNLWTLALIISSGVGVTAGGHRLWAHKTYKAKWPLELILTFFFSMAGQNSIYEWVRDHRVHHKFSETDADPHNSRRGFWFSHIGWLMMEKHPEVKEKGKTVDMSDLKANPIVELNRRFFVPIGIFCWFIVPVFTPVYLWDENFLDALLVSGIFRYVLTLNIAFFVNSAAHMWGNRPYDKSIQPTENMFVSMFSWGEGWHNYHHAFPWDYKAAELGNYRMNMTTMCIDFWAWLGLAYDLKTVTPEMILKRAQRTGDGTHPVSADDMFSE